MTSVDDGGSEATTTSQASSSTMWSNAVRWIESNGGYVHPQLRYNESQRQVYLGHHNSDTTAASSLSPSSSSASQTNGDSSMVIEAGMTLLRIPDDCLVSLHSVEKDEQFGKSLFEIVHSLSNSSSSTTITSSTQSGSAYPSQKKKTTNLLYHNDQDVVLALFLAHLQQLRQKQSISFYNPYLDTLPFFLHSSSDNNNDESKVDNDNNKKDEEETSSSPHQLLPRQWSLKTLKRCLHGTSLYQRIINERNGVRDEYELIKTAWMKQQASAPTTSFPTLEQYNTMMAAVTSRGFEGLGYDGVDVMIPLLDLLNHYRGGDSSNSDFARVRYERYNNLNECNEKKKDEVEVDDGDEGEGVSPPPLKRIKTTLKSSVGGGVKVTTAQRISLPINATIPLQMTYGAKSNSTLLGRYGFCIEHNVEPDGSCNDVVEIQLQTGCPPVKLQRGPKSYTYGCLIKALQLFGDDEQSLPCGDRVDESEKRLQQESGNNDADREGATEVDDDGGLQAFLDGCEEEDYGLGECDEEEEEDDDLDDMMYGHTSADAFLPSSSSSNAVEEMKKKNELQALDALYSSLGRALERCEKNSLICFSNNGRSSCSGDKCIPSSQQPPSSFSPYDDYCIIWVKSEIRTISFYMKAVEMIQSQLLMGVGDANYVKREYGMIDCIDLEQINDLVDAFMTIRHPGYQQQLKSNDVKK